MHEQHQLLREAEVSFAVLGRDGQFSLYELTAPTPLDQDLVSADVAKGFNYCGVVGFNGEYLTTSHEPDPSSWITTVHAARAVSQILRERYKAESASASVAWLEALHKLPDPRDPR